MPQPIKLIVEAETEQAEVKVSALNKIMRALKPAAAEASASFNQVASGLESATQEAMQGGSELENFSGKAGLAEGASTALGAALAGLLAAGAIKAYSEIRKLWMQVESFTKSSVLFSAKLGMYDVSLQQMGKQAGYTSGEIDEAEESLRQKGITTEATRRSLQRLIRAEIDLSAASGLARAAQDAAVSAGIDSSQAFDRLILGIQRRSGLIVDDLGFTIQSTKVYKSFAEQIGKTTKELTEQEKTQAVVNDILRQAGLVTGTYEAAMTSAGKQAGSMARHVDSVREALGDVFQEQYSAKIQFQTKLWKALYDVFQRNKESFKIIGESLGIIARTSGDIKVDLLERLMKALDQIIKLTANLTQVAAGTLEVLRALDPSLTTLKTLFGAVAAAIGLMLSKMLIIPIAAKGLGILTTVLPGIAAGLGGVSAAVGGLGAALTGLLFNPITLAIGAIAGAFLLVRQASLAHGRHVAESMKQASGAMERTAIMAKRHAVAIEDLQGRLEHLEFGENIVTEEGVQQVDAAFEKMIQAVRTGNEKLAEEQGFSLAESRTIVQKKLSETLDTVGGSKMLEEWNITARETRDLLTELGRDVSGDAFVRLATAVEESNGAMLSNLGYSMEEAEQIVATHMDNIDEGLIKGNEGRIAQFAKIAKAVEDSNTELLDSMGYTITEARKIVEQGAQGLGDPIAEEILNTAEETEFEAKNWGEKLVVALADGIAAGASTLIDILINLGNIIAEWLAPASPPKFLPDLDKWGKGAADIYMEGWTKFDHSIFQELAGTIEGYMRTFQKFSKGTGVDLVGKIFSMQDEAAKIVNEMRTSGTVTSETLDTFINSLEGVSPEVKEFTRSMVTLEVAQRRAYEAQEKINQITKEYNDQLEPMGQRLAEINNMQSEVGFKREQARLEELIAHHSTSAQERMEAKLELEKLLLQNGMRRLNFEKNQKLQVQQQELKAAGLMAEEEQKRADAIKGIIDAQIHNLELTQEQKDLLEQIAAEQAAGEGATAGAAGRGGGGAGDAAAVAGAAGGGLKKVFDDMQAGVKSRMEELVERIKEPFTKLQDKWYELLEVWDGVWKKLTKLWDDLWGPGGHWERAKNWAVTNYESLKTNFLSIFGEGGTISTGIASVKRWFTETFGAGGTVEQKINHIKQRISDIFGEGGEIAVIWEKTKELLGLVVTKMEEDKEAIIAAVDAIWTKVKTAFSEGVNSVIGVIGRVTTALSDLWNWLSQHTFNILVKTTHESDDSEHGSPRLKIHYRLMDLERYLNNTTFRPRVDASAFGQFTPANGLPLSGISQPFAVAQPLSGSTSNVNVYINDQGSMHMFLRYLDNVIDQGNLQ